MCYPLTNFILSMNSFIIGIDVQEGIENFTLYLTQKKLSLIKTLCPL